MLKKAGIVVLGAAAGMISLAPLASAGEAPQHAGDNHSQHHDGGRARGGDDCTGASAGAGHQVNTGSQLIGVNNANLQAPINQLGVLSSYDNDCHDGPRGGRHGGGRHGGGHHGDDRGGRDGGSRAEAGHGDQINTGDQLVGLNNLSAQLPINQLGVLSSYVNR